MNITPKTIKKNGGRLKLNKNGYVPRGRKRPPPYIGELNVEGFLYHVNGYAPADKSSETVDLYLYEQHQPATYRACWVQIRRGIKGVFKLLIRKRKAPKAVTKSVPAYYNGRRYSEEAEMMPPKNPD